MPTRIQKDMPCKPDCPNREPGCFCDLKREWNEKHEAQKKAIRDIKNRENMTFEAKPESWKKKKGRRA